MLKMEQQQNRQSPAKTSQTVTLPAYTAVHKENEKKSPARQIKQLIEDKLLSKSNSNASTKQSGRPVSTHIIEDPAKSLKFGIRVLPTTSTIEQAQQPSIAKHINRKQTDYENNDNSEKTNENNYDKLALPPAQPPIVNKRTKLATTTKTGETNSMSIVDEQPSNVVDFQRHGSVTSSGIRRDAAGIPQEIPNEMMQAAMVAQGNRKNMNSAGATASLDCKKSKGKAPNPPSMSDDVTDGANNSYMLMEVNVDDNNGKNRSDASTPISDRKIMGSDTESHNAGFDHGK